VKRFGVRRKARFSLVKVKNPIEYRRKRIIEELEELLKR